MREAASVVASDWLRALVVVATWPLQMNFPKCLGCRAESSRWGRRQCPPMMISLLVWLTMLAQAVHAHAVQPHVVRS